MTLRRFDRPLDYLLDTLSRFADERGHTGDVFRAAAKELREMVADKAIIETTVVITSGWDMDPIVGEVEELHELLGAARSDLETIDDRIDDVLGTLRRRISDGDELAALRSVVAKLFGVGFDVCLKHPGNVDVLSWMGVDASWVGLTDAERAAVMGTLEPRPQ